MEVEIEGHQYRTGKLTPFQQFDLVRWLGPAIAAYFTGVAAASTESDDSLSNLLAQVKGLMPLLDILAKMPPDDVSNVLHLCLSVCQRAEAAGQWQRVMAGPKLFQYSDITMVAMNRLVVAVIKDNLSAFFDALPALANGEQQTAARPQV